MNIFGSRLKQLRTSKKITQNELSKLLDVSRSAVAGYETSGKQPDFEKVLLLANFFEVSTDYLLGITDDPTPSQASDQLHAFIADHNLSAMFHNYNKWTDEEKKILLNFLEAQEALRREKNK